jgi:DNA-directed RNA polymerase specialized sigma subunit
MSEIFNLDALFTYSDAAPLPEADEVAAIEAAQLGDESATLALMEAYGPALRAAVSRFSGLVEGDAPIDPEDARMTAVSGFMEALHAHDPAKGSRLAGTVAQYVNEALTEATKTTRPALSVPKRTLSRFFGILREAEGDVAAARDLAPSREMTHATFDQILAAARPGSIEALRDPSGAGTELRDLVAQPVFTPSPVVDVEDRILADAALRACDDDEHRVVSLQYGFSPVVEFVDGQRVQVDRLPSDREIGDIIGMTRPTVQRRGKSALTKMRKALGVTHVSN